jgi:GR25 family glycosyltransferase involved in LPS biosynthesis
MSSINFKTYKVYSFSYKNPNRFREMNKRFEAINTFLDSDADYGVICEDDVYVRKSFKRDIQIVIAAFERLNISILQSFAPRIFDRLLPYKTYNISNSFRRPIFVLSGI